MNDSVVYFNVLLEWYAWRIGTNYSQNVRIWYRSIVMLPWLNLMIVFSTESREIYIWSVYMHVYMHVINILYKYGRIHPLQNPFRCIYAKRGKIVSTAHVKNSILKFIKIKFNSSCYCKLRLGSKITRNGSNVKVNLCCLCLILSIKNA